MFKKNILGLLAVLYSCCSQAQTPAFISDSLDAYVQREMKRWQVPGLSVCVVKDGKTIISKGYGVREWGKNGPVDENTLFQIASNSKAFTGTSLALLAQQGRLSLDDKVSRWMPDFKLQDELATREVTLRDLLCHRIGFATFQSDFLNWGSKLSRQELIRNMRNVSPSYSFRSRYGYCNAGFLTAGEIIPLVSDTSWDNYIRFHFFAPLLMNRSSTTYVEFINDQNSCKAHGLVNGKLQLIPIANIDNLGPAASINSSVKDLANWLLMQLDSGRFNGRQVVPFSVLQQTRSSQMLVGDQNSKTFPRKHFNTYGLGWFLEDYEARKVVQHDGGANGFVTTTCFLPEENLGIAVLTNSDANTLYAALRQQIIDAYLGLPYRNYSEIYYKRASANQAEEEKELEAERKLVARKLAPSLPLQAYTGRYHNKVYGNMEVRLVKGQLKMFFENHPGLIGHLEPRDGNSFLCTYSDPTWGIKVIPFQARGQEIASVSVSVNGFIDYMSYDFTRQGPLENEK